MALFQKNPFNTQESKPLYTLGLNKTVLVVGLGNPGKQYDNTRHNIGFECVDTFVEKSEMPGWVAKKDLKCFMTGANLGGVKVVVIKPTTFMNLSGEAVRAVADFYKIPARQIVAVYDELDLIFGQIRMRVGGSAAGHNGVKSVIEHIGEGFGRVRVGIGPNSAVQQTENIDGAAFVLGKFTAEEKKHLPALAREVTAILTEYIYSGELPHDTRTFTLP